MDNNFKPSLLPYRWIILVVVWLGAFIGSYAQFQLPPLAYKLMPELNLTPSQYASILTAPMLPAVFFSIVAGTLADRFGVKRVVTVGFIFATVGIFFRYVATNYWQMLILMALAGTSSAFLNANIAKILGAWFPPEQLSKAMGIYITSPTFAMSVGMATTAMFSSIKAAFITAGIGCILTAVIWVALAKDKPEGAPELPAMPVAQYLGVAARSKNVWLVGLALLFMMGGAMAFSGFLPDALHSVRGIDPVTAGFLASMGTIGTLLGSILGPIICDRIGYMRRFLFSAGALGAVTIFYSWQAPLGAWIWMMLILSGVLAGAAGPILMSFPMLLPEIGPVYAGSAGGLMATLQLIGAVAIPTFIIAPLAGHNYYMMFGLAGMSIFLLGIVSLFLPELGRKAIVKPSGPSQSL
ncbi:MFS transporter [Moorella sp. E306M]|jgi:NNP family nitrate/nitrite transporter-like MFS transporter|uniref:MFS transporter n=1 Tax=Moorella sp. E306M TaxID=2572683 RepID=UPI0010FFB833|nr:MFS transporter [Moorella sp. E306M]GEA17295.1 MFS transporter [Moorella sp. E306M]